MPGSDYTFGHHVRLGNHSARLPCCGQRTGDATGLTPGQSLFTTHYLIDPKIVNYSHKRNML